MENKDKLIAELKAENKILKKVAFQSQNAAIHINQQAEKYEERIKVLEKDLVDWQDAYKELEKAHDKIQGAYQDDHCDLLKYIQTLQEIKELAEFHITQADSEDVQEDMKQIIDLITKAESRG